MAPSIALGALLLLLVFAGSVPAKRLANSGYYTIVIQTNGQAYAMGKNEFGQLGLNVTGFDVYLPQPMLLVSHATDVSVGGGTTCLVDQGGQVKCVGNDAYGQLGTGRNDEYEGLYRVYPQSELLAPVSELRAAAVEVYCNAHACCARLVDGGVQCWGKYLQEQIQTPQIVAGLAKVQGVSLGDKHACFVAVGGKLYCMGDNQFGQLGTGNTTAQTALTPVVGLAAENIVSVACGFGHTCAVNRAGAMFCWGYNAYGRLGNGRNVETYPSPIQVEGLTSGVASAWVSGYSSLALMKDGTAKAFGSDSYGMFGNGVKGEWYTPIVFGQGVTGVVELTGGSETTCVLLKDQRVKCTGSAEFGQLGTGGWTRALTLVPMVGVPATKAPTRNPAWKQPTSSPIPVGKRLAGRGYHFLVLQRDGQVYATGGNEYGQLGLDTFDYRVNLPQRMLFVSRATDVSAGAFHTCLVDQGGQAKCVGRDHYGQVGDSATGGQQALVPVVGLDTGVAEVYCNHYSSCARMANGQIKCWGQYLRKKVHIPLEVTGFGNDKIKAISMGYWHFCFLAVGGKLYCVGDNDSGQLGTGNSSSRMEPAPVVGLASKNIVSVACGESHTCAVNSAGAIFCWGFAGQGRLGNGAIAGAFPNPIQVSGLASGVASVWTSDTKSFALLRNGTMMMFGADVYSDFAPSNTGMQPLPIVFSQLAGVVEVSTGYYATCLLLQNDQVQCSGSNTLGQLGLGTEVEGSVPLVPMVGIPVTDAPTPNPAWKHPTSAPTQTVVRGNKRLAGLGNHFVVRQLDGQVYGTGRNTAGQLGVGSTTNVYLPMEMLHVNNASDVSVGDYHTCLVDQGGQAKCVGGNRRGQLGDKTDKYKSMLVPVHGLDSGVVEVFCGDMGSCARMESGGAKCWGMDLLGPANIEGLGNDAVKGISLGYANVCFVTAAGKLFCLGDDGYGKVRLLDTAPIAMLASENVMSVACEDTRVCAVNLAGAMFCWNSDKPTPIQVVGLSSGVASTWTGGGNSFALMRGGTVKAFGPNKYGELGVGSIGEQRLPIAFGNGMSGVVEVRGAFGTTCVLLQGGAVQCAGRNRFGQMGVGKETTSSFKLVAMKGLPTRAPTKAHTTEAPTKKATKAPTLKPTKKVTLKPTKKATLSPTAKPTLAPTAQPSLAPTDQPTTLVPTKKATRSPTVKPTKRPILAPTKRPTKVPTQAPSKKPTTAKPVAAS